MLYKSYLAATACLPAAVLLVGCGGGGGGGDSANVDPADRTAPVITVLGSSTVDHEQGTTYSDQGAGTALDHPGHGVGGAGPDLSFLAAACCGRGKEGRMIRVRGLVKPEQEPALAD